MMIHSHSVEEAWLRTIPVPTASHLSITDGGTPFLMTCWWYILMLMIIFWYYSILKYYYLYNDIVEILLIIIHVMCDTISDMILLMIPFMMIFVGEIHWYIVLWWCVPFQDIHILSDDSIHYTWYIITPMTFIPLLIDTSIPIQTILCYKYSDTWWFDTLMCYSIWWYLSVSTSSVSIIDHSFYILFSMERYK